MTTGRGGENTDDLCLCLRVILEQASAGDPPAAETPLAPPPASGPTVGAPPAPHRPGSLRLGFRSASLDTAACGQKLLLAVTSGHSSVFKGTPALFQLGYRASALPVQIFLFCDSFRISGCLPPTLSRNLDFLLQPSIAAPRREAERPGQQAQDRRTKGHMTRTRDGDTSLR